MGTVIDLFIGSTPGQKLDAVKSARAIPGKGLQGDRYFDKNGTFSKKDTDDRELTLIEAESIEALAREYQTEIHPGAARRNVLTRGIALNHLVGREFQIGNVKARGMRLCEPCGHLEKLTNSKVRAGLVHRGGLRAKILTEGEIRVGDEIR
jgi:MOSC domain-containing protein YiiM